VGSKHLGQAGKRQRLPSKRLAERLVENGLAFFLAKVVLLDVIPDAFCDLWGKEKGV
jgi:hypothetical protein